ncbi:MAG: hypothetical protein KF819_35810 [Labilithrix sp.]|nr:hypothetical protein [Labilithrix sp.]
MTSFRWSFVSCLAVASIACTEAAQPASSSEAQAATQALAAEGGAARPHGPRHGPPPIAFEACASKAAGDACTVALPDKTVAGTCASPPAGAPDARVFCLPNDMPPPGHGPPPGGRPPGPPPAEAFTACDGKTAGATCAVTLGDHTLNGSCLAPPPDSGETRLACAPPHPPHASRPPR